MTQVRRRLLTFALLLLLAAPAAWSAPALRSGPASVPSWTNQALALLAGWMGLGPSTVWTKEGCKLDPDGRCLPPLKEGCKLDPFGRCLPPLKEGCMVDPFGRCQPGAAPNRACGVGPDGRCHDDTTIDSGCMVDPFGRCLPGS